jgi:hypothetical protein
LTIAPRAGAAGSVWRFSDRGNPANAGKFRKEIDPKGNPFHHARRMIMTGKAGRGFGDR